MHGRAKVPTTADQQEAKKKEREKKAKAYNEVTSKIYSKRAAEEYDDKALKLTEAVLRPNPEILTLWNYRREIFQSKKKEISESELQSYLDAELSFLETCLRANPKAYGIWLHREWVILNIPNPNWKREQELCNLFLRYDERNFHCWDYRRFVIQHSGVSNEEELAFTSAKIADNFSNYSAWHYRSKILPLLDRGETGQLSKEVSDREFELVQNAFFTDPGDQSAWFYHNWLLGKSEPPLSVLCVLALRKENKVAVVLNKNAKMKGGEGIVLHINGEQVEGLCCHAPFAPPSWPSSLWICDLQSSPFPEQGSVGVRFEWDGLQASCTIDNDCDEGSWVNLPAVSESFETKSATKEVLMRELEMCRELLQLEPENKWCILTTLTLSQATDPVTHHDEVVGFYDKLIKIDPYRRGYYMDRRSEFITQVVLFRYLKNFGQMLDLSNKGLTRLYCPELMCVVKEINLEGNRVNISSNPIPLLSVKKLNLSNTGLDRINLSGLTKLTTLSLEDNNISSTEDLEGLEDSKLKTLSLKGNPLMDKMAEKEIIQSIQTYCPTLVEFNGKQL